MEEWKKSNFKNGFCKIVYETHRIFFPYRENKINFFVLTIEYCSKDKMILQRVTCPK